MEDVSRLALFAQENWDISHSQCMEPGDNHCMEEAWFLVGQACDAVKFDPDLVALNFHVSPNVCSLGFSCDSETFALASCVSCKEAKDMPQKAQRCDLEIEFLEVQGATIVVPDLTNCQVRGDVPVFV